MHNHIFELSCMGQGKYYLNYLGDNHSLELYLCEKLADKSIDIEIEKRGIKPDEPVAIIPEDSIESKFQIFQGSIHYLIYRRVFGKIRNQGLLLSMLIMGDKQLKDTITKTRKSFLVSEKYYLVILDKSSRINTDKCVGLDITRTLSYRDQYVMAKNIHTIIDKL